MTTDLPRDGDRIADGVRERCIRAYGADAVAKCTLCGMAFVRLRSGSTECRTCWHDGLIGHYALGYRSVLTALRDAGLPAAMTQTGGMTMAIEFSCLGGGHFLVGDAEAGGLGDPSAEDERTRRYSLAYFEEENFDMGGEIPGLALLPSLPPGVSDSVSGLETDGEEIEQVVRMALAGSDAVRRWRALPSDA